VIVVKETFENLTVDFIIFALNGVGKLTSDNSDSSP